MVQPFEIFTTKYLAGLIRLKKTWLVSQTYTRGRRHGGAAPKQCILVTDYDDRGIAEIHYKAVRNDKFGAIVNLANPKHYARMEDMLSDESPYLLYWSVTNDLDRFKKVTFSKYKDNIRRYIAQHTDWRISADAAINTQIEFTFGELYIIIKRGDQKLRVKFEEIEKA